MAYSVLGIEPRALVRNRGGKNNGTKVFVFFFPSLSPSMLFSVCPLDTQPWPRATVEASGSQDFLLAPTPPSNLPNETPFNLVVYVPPTAQLL